MREHWSLVFDDPGQATKRAFASGDHPDRAASGWGPDLADPRRGGRGRDHLPDGALIK